MKQSAKRIGLIILIAVLALIECMLCIGIALDGKFQVELSEDLGAIEAFYRDVTILEIFMFINLGIAVVSLILLWRKSKVRISSVTLKKHTGYCKVCGCQLDYLPWGEDGKTPSFDICPCCGVEFGNEDYTEESIKKYREKWINGGAHWFDTKLRPSNWSLQEQLSNAARESDNNGRQNNK